MYIEGEQFCVVGLRNTCRDGGLQGVSARSSGKARYIHWYISELFVEFQNSLIFWWLRGKGHFSDV
jgi:hypothetical protein